AGSYGIQELPDGFVKEINGSLDNIIGLCSIAVLDVINKFV
ncbi:Maf family protein, partial [bacterium]|nr:Maf family protein [bacterium]